MERTFCLKPSLAEPSIIRPVPDARLHSDIRPPPERHPVDICMRISRQHKAEDHHFNGLVLLTPERSQLDFNLAGIPSSAQAACFSSILERLSCHVAGDYGALVRFEGLDGSSRYASLLDEIGSRSGMSQEQIALLQRIVCG